MSKVRFYNINIDVLNTIETLSICKGFINSTTNHLIFFLNAHCFNIAQKNQEYRNALNNADIVLNDGIGIQLGSKKLRIALKENMNGTDFIPRLLEFSKENEQKVYLLGGTEGVTSIAKRKTENKIPGISIVGIRNGYFDFNNDEEIISDIINKGTDILIVGMGVPRQELWLNKNRTKLKGVKISIAGGAILDFISEKVERAPKWMQKTGTEWVFRLLQEPSRLFKRYALGIPLFFYYTLKLK
jgi:N-acetylglucosaminyldiphosphoundecaprenol N-acetyl-beta-D-mannosaminyltransferase